VTVDRTPMDDQVWQEELNPFLPLRIFDAHVHLFASGCLQPGSRFPPKSIYGKFGNQFTLQQHLDWSAAWLPGRTLGLCHFGHPSPVADLEASAKYSGAISDCRQRFGLSLVAPWESAETVRQRILTHRLAGYKAYLDFVRDKPKSEITIHDMLPAGQMRVADEMGLAITLHIPRAARLADPLNQRQMVELCRNYPNAKIIFAHIGRAYFLKNVVGFLDRIADCPNAFVDTAMVNHEGVLEYTFRNFPRDRILFGSDAPVAWLRGKSVEVNNQYAYLMGEDYEIGTSIHDRHCTLCFTTFFYEQLRGIRLAAERTRLSAVEIENVFFNNAMKLFSAVVKIHPDKPAKNTGQ
jgi:hypothetical protein